MSVLAENVAKLDGYLARFREAGILNRIAGQDAAGAGGVFQSISPVDKSVICDVAHGTAPDIDAAATAAQDAFAGWRDMPCAQAHLTNRWPSQFSRLICQRETRCI